MAGTAGPNLGLTWGWSAHEDGWGVGGFNPDMAELDAVVHLSVTSQTNTPPGSPTNGMRYLCGTTPTGAWAGHAQAVAVYSTIGTPGWSFYAPKLGWRAWNEGTDAWVRFDGTTWVADSGSGTMVIDDLTDVDTTTVEPTDGDTLVWDGTDEVWKPGAAAGGVSFNPVGTWSDTSSYAAGDVAKYGSSPIKAYLCYADVEGSAPSFDTFNSADMTNAALSNGDTTAAAAASGQGYARAHIYQTSGKYYFEQMGLHNILNNNTGIYVVTPSWGLGIGGESAGWGALSGIPKSVAVDMDLKKIWKRDTVGGSWQPSGDPAAGTGGMDISTLTHIAGGVTVCWYMGTGGTGNESVDMNFGQTTFADTPPAGFTEGWGTTGSTNPSPDTDPDHWIG